MAARQKAKASKNAVKRGRGKTKARKSPARKMTKSRKASARKSTKKASRKTTAKTAPRKTAAKKKVPAQGASARAGATKNNRKHIVGEGDYEASRAFLRDQADFVKENKAKIPERGKEARAALDGSEGPALLAAEAEARGHSKNQPQESG